MITELTSHQESNLPTKESNGLEPKVILSAFGCDVHLTPERIKNTYAELCNDNKSSKAWGELFYDTINLELIQDSVNLTKEQVIEIVDYMQTWLTTKGNSG